MMWGRYFWVLCSILLAALPFPVAAEFHSGSELKGFLEKWENKDSGIDGAYGAG